MRTAWKYFRQQLPEGSASYVWLRKQTMQGSFCHIAVYDVTYDLIVWPRMKRTLWCAFLWMSPSKVCECHNRKPRRHPLCGCYEYVSIYTYICIVSYYVSVRDPSIYTTPKYRSNISKIKVYPEMFKVTVFRFSILSAARIMVPYLCDWIALLLPFVVFTFLSCLKIHATFYSGNTSHFPRTTVNENNSVLQTFRRK